MATSPFLSLDIEGLDVDVNLSMDFDGRGLLWRSSVSALGHVSVVPIKHRKTMSQKSQKPRGRIMNKINTSFYYSLHHIRKIEINKWSSRLGIHTLRFLCKGIFKTRLSNDSVHFLCGTFFLQFLHKQFSYLYICTNLKQAHKLNLETPTTLTSMTWVHFLIAFHNLLFSISTIS